jgi:hypothetical protein
VEIEHGIILGDLSAVIQEVMLKVADLERQIKDADGHI